MIAMTDEAWQLEGYYRYDAFGQYRPQKGSEERTNSVVVSGAADTVGPTISSPLTVVDVA
jgi:hypothetical protein